MNRPKNAQGGKNRRASRRRQDCRCRRVLRNLYRVLDEGSADEVCGEIRSHLEGCRACAGQYEAILRLSQICRELPKATLSELTRERMKKALREALSARMRARAGTGFEPL